jgi:hypothetical protein
VTEPLVLALRRGHQLNRRKTVTGRRRAELGPIGLAF